LGHEYGISTPDRPEYYQPREGFMTKVRDIEARWIRRWRTSENIAGETSNVTPLFGIAREDSPQR
jgi:hypothetical protein